jgi:microcystin-dependent protein
MSTPFLGEIRIFGFNFNPRGWAFCQGQLLAISQNTALFSILGTTYGGNGTSDFALPNLQGYVPLHSGQGAGLSQYFLGEVTGSQTVTLLTTELPAHAHAANCSSIDGDSADPIGNVPAKDALGGNNVFSNSQDSLMSTGAISLAGNGLPHNNLQPYLAMNYCIAMLGVFPSRN